MNHLVQYCDHAVTITCFLFVHIGSLLGQAIDSVKGLKGTQPGEYQLHPVEKSDVVTVEGETVTESNEKQFGPYLHITFHSNFISLLKGIYGSIQFNNDSFQAGGLVLDPSTFRDDPVAQQRIADVAGILPEHTTSSNLGFVLVRYWKVIYTHKATSFTVKENYVDDIKTTNHSIANEILSTFNEYGTHYVSQYREGDFIYQVFVYEKDILNEIEAEFPAEPIYRFGYKSSYYRTYTRPHELLPDGTYAGYVAYAGKILAASNDTAFHDIEQLLYDTTYDVRSIFMFLLEENIAVKTEAMSTLIISHVILISISKAIFLADDKDLKQRQELLKGALFQNYDRGSSVGLKKPNGVPITTSNYQHFNPDLVTRTATSYTAILEAVFDLENLDIINPQFVTNLFIFADTIEIQSNANIALPGTDNIYLICHHFLAYSSGNLAPQIVVGSHGSAAPNVHIIAETFDGVMKVVSPFADPVTYSERFVLETESNEGVRSVVANPSKQLTHPLPSVLPQLYVEPDVGDYESQFFVSSFVNGLNIAMITIESVYTLKVSKSTFVAQKSLQWVIDTLAEATQQVQLSTALEMVLSRALLLQMMNPDPRKGPFILVPKLKFSLYQAQYEQLLKSVELYEKELAEISSAISEQMQTEKIIDSQEELNENILEIGRFLVEMVKADADYFEDVNDMHQEIIENKERELQDEIEKSADLHEDVMNYTKIVERVGEELHEQVEANGILTITKMILNVVSTVGGMFLGGPVVGNTKEEVKGIARVAEKVKKVTDMTAKLTLMYGKPFYWALNHINTDLLSLSDMSSFSDNFPTSLDWSDFDADILHITSDGYLHCCATKAAEYKNAAQKLSARGKAYLDSQKAVSALQYDIITNQMHSDIAQKQTDRLDELAGTMDQDHLTDVQANTTNLYELGNILQNKANTVRMELAKAYGTMDAALQFDYLKPPTPLKGYDTMSIQESAAKQITDAIYALESLPIGPTDLPDPVIIEIPHVAVSKLTSDIGYKYTLPLTYSSLIDYIRVRILEMRVTINSIESAGTDDIYIQSNFTGANFRDRGLDREEKKFSTYNKLYRYVYNYKTNETVVGNRPSTDDFAEMTPFGEWIFSIPKLSSSNTNVDIVFSKKTTTLRIEFYLNTIFHPALASKKSKSSCDTQQCLLDLLYQNSITGSWDAVMVMDMARLNALWEEKYNYQEDHGGFIAEIQTDWAVIAEGWGDTFEGRMTGTVGPPLASFMLNNPSSLKLTMIMTDAVYSERKIDENGHIECCINTTFDEPVIIESFNDIAIISGSVDEQQTVIVDLSTSLVSITVDGLTGTEAAIMEAMIQEKFQEILSQAYDLGTVDFDSEVTPPALQPRQFHFTTGGVDDTSKLFICILTNREFRPQEDPTVCEIFVISKDTDPVIPAGYSGALYVNSHLMYAEIIHPTFATKFGEGTEVSDVDGAGSHAASEISAPYDVSFTCNYEVQTCCADKAAAVSVANWPGDLFLHGASNGGLYLNKDSVRYSQNVMWYDCLNDQNGGTGCNFWDNEDDVGTSIDIKEIVMPTVDINGLIQFPKFTLSESTVAMDRESEEFDKSIVEVEKCMRNRVNNLGFTIDSVSVFVLTNLIFPEAKVMNTTKALMPGDLLVLGHIVKDYVPNPEKK